MFFFFPENCCCLPSSMLSWVQFCFLLSDWDDCERFPGVMKIIWDHLRYERYKTKPHKIRSNVIHIYIHYHILIHVGYLLYAQSLTRQLQLQDCAPMWTSAPAMRHPEIARNFPSPLENYLENMQLQLLILFQMTESRIDMFQTSHIVTKNFAKHTHTHMHTSEMVYWQNINMPHLHLLSKDCHCLLVRRIYPNGFRFRPRDVDVQLGRRCPGVTYQYLDPPRTKYP